MVLRRYMDSIEDRSDPHRIFRLVLPVLVEIRVAVSIFYTFCYLLLVWRAIELLTEPDEVLFFFGCDLEYHRGSHVEWFVPPEE